MESGNNTVYSKKNNTLFCIGLLLLLVGLLSPVWAGAKKSITMNLLLLDVTVNQKKMTTIIECYEDERGTLWVDQKNLSLLKLPLPNKQPIIFSGKQYYALHWYHAVQYQLNRRALHLSLIMPTDYFSKTVIGTTGYNPEIIRPEQLGLFLNYDLTSIRNAAANITSNSGLVELGLSNQWGVGTNNILISNYNTVNNSDAYYHFVRLSTTWTLDQPEKIATWRFGDAITGASSWSNATRFGGIQYATNFTTQPNFITFPLPGFKGEALVPTNVQVFVNGILNQQQNIDNGSYLFNNIPVVTGAGNVSVITQDLLGRSQTISLPYYASPFLLKSGLKQYSYEAGFMREDYGLTSNGYQYALSTATYQQGITDNWTLGTHAELLSMQQTLGISSDYLVNQLGIISVATATSHSQYGQGWLGSLGVSRQTPTLNIGCKTTMMSSNYQQIGIQSGHSGIIGASTTNQFFLGYDTGSFGSLGFSYTTVKQFAASNASGNPGPQLSKIGTATYSYNFFNNISFTVSVINDFEQSSNNQVYAGLMIPLDSQHTVNTYVNRQNADVQPGAIYTRNLPLGNGYGYHVVATNDGTTGPGADVTYQNDVGSYTAKAYRTAQQNYYEADISGAVLYLDKAVFLSRQMTQSYALVQVPHYDNVRVYYQNQLVGRTNSMGNLFVAQILPYQENTLAIEPRDLPLTAVIGETEIKVQPYYRSGTVAKFHVSESSTLLLRLIRQEGQYVPAGTVVTIDHVNHFIVGYEGTLFISNIRQGMISGSAALAKGSCHFEMAVDKNQLNRTRATNVICY